MIQDATGGETEKEITTLLIAGGPQGDGTSCPGGHGIIVVLMSLDVSPKLKLAMFGVVNLCANNNCPWAESRRDSVIRREAVEPKDARVHNFNN